MVATARWDALGTWCEALTLADGDLPAVAEVAREQVAGLDRACSADRPDSELSRLAVGSPQPVSPLLCGAVAAALRAAAFSDGLVGPGAGWQAVVLDEERCLLTVPAGSHLDIATAALGWLADRIADLCCDELGIGCLINLGGAIAVRGETPDGGWQVEIDDHGHAGPPGHPVIPMAWPGGLATASATGGEWRTVTVAARSCERAGAASAAAIALGDSAPRWLTQRELPARLVHAGGLVVQTNGWPRQRWID